MLILLEKLLNSIVRRANGGLMPAKIPTFLIQYGLTAGHSILNSTDKYRFLCDIIQIHLGNHYTFYSIGDLCGYLGTIICSCGIIYWIFRFTTIIVIKLKEASR